MRIEVESNSYVFQTPTYGKSAIIALTLVIMECTATSFISFKEATYMNECVEVQDWLKAMPLRDNPGWTAMSAARASSTWEEWIDKGRNITGIEECLLSFLVEETNAVTRSSIVLALGFVGGVRSIPTLISILESDVPLVQMEAAAALGRLGKAEAIGALCEALKNPDPNVRANACISLGRIGGPRVNECLKDAATDNDPFVQAAAKEALRRHE